MRHHERCQVGILLNYASYVPASKMRLVQNPFWSPVATTSRHERLALILAFIPYGDRSQHLPLVKMVRA